MNRRFVPNLPSTYHGRKIAAYPCPRCGAKANVLCTVVRTHGKVAQFFHTSRVDLSGLKFNDDRKRKDFKKVAFLFPEDEDTAVVTYVGDDGVRRVSWPETIRRDFVLAELRRKEMMNLQKDHQRIKGVA